MAAYTENQKVSWLFVAFYATMMLFTLVGVAVQQWYHETPAPYRDSHLVEPDMLCLIDVDPRLSPQNACLIQTIRKSTGTVFHRFFHANCSGLPLEGVLDPCRVWRTQIYREEDYQPERDVMEYIVRPCLDLCWYLVIGLQLGVVALGKWLKPPFSALTCVTLNYFALVWAVGNWTNPTSILGPDGFWLETDVRCAGALFITFLLTVAMGIGEGRRLSWRGNLLLCLLYDAIVVMSVLVDGFTWLVVVPLLGTATFSAILVKHPIKKRD